MSIAEKLTTIAENQEKVFEAGKKAEYDRFWDLLQENGNRVKYTRAFCDTWKTEMFYPKYDMQPTDASFMFAFCNIENIKERLEECKVTIDFSQVKAFQQVFQSTKTYALPKIDMRNATSSSYTFQDCQAVEIDGIIVSENTPFGSNFMGYYTKLEKCIFEGTIGQNGLNVSTATKLNHDSLMSVINALKDYSEDTSGTEWAVTLGSDNLAKLTNEEKAIATEKGWTLA